MILMILGDFMKITITAIGTRGDIQPHVALGRGLADAGHDVKLAVDVLFGAMVREQGLAFAPIKADPMSAMQEDIHKLGNNPVRIARWMSEAVNQIGDEYVEGYLAANEGADLMIFSSIAAMAGLHIGAYLRLPMISTALQPVVPTTAYPYSAGRIFPDWLPFLGAVNKRSYTYAIRAFYRMFYKMINQNRENVLGLPALPWNFYRDIDLKPFPIFHGFSRHVIPYPADYNENQIFTGYWFLDQEKDWQPPEELESFLSAGAPPVYIGFGSMVDQDASALTELIVRAVEICGQRAVLLGGWADLGVESLPDAILRLDSVPHSYLFRKVAAVAHHGGAGTTAMGLWAGKPSVIVPFLSDQPFWGWRVEKLGVGPRPIPRLKLTAEKLAAAITQAVTDEGIKHRAAALGEKISAEDGVGNAVRAVEEIVATKRDQIMPTAALYG
jgi:UDP:flavonoid glycosyltransferase YjiC (YdhE family)